MSYSFLGSRKAFLRHIWLMMILGLAGAIFLVLEFFGVIWHNEVFAAKYSVKGLDVSHHQHQIDWKKVAETQRYQFVFIKATEGHDFIDDLFAQNWREAKAQGLRVGAYHFFSTRSSGQEQADWFMATVPQDSTALPPVIDIEIAIDKDPAKIKQELRDLTNQLEKHYQKKPILYVTYDTYRAYIEGDFAEYSLWIRDILKPAFLPDRQWVFWQYSNRGHVPGIDSYVDINVFNGELADLKQL